MKGNKRKGILSCILAVCMILQLSAGNLATAYAADSGPVVIDATEYGADPSGVKDSTRAIQDAFAAAKKATEDGASAVTVTFPKGEYQIYKDFAEKREYHTSNTNSIESPVKTIGLLIEDQENLTVDGNGSLFMMHGNMMALAVVRSENVTLSDFSWDFAVPTVSEMTITGMGTEEGKPYTDFFIPSCFPHEIKGTTIQWNSEPSPYTGELYWTENGIHNAYSIVAYHPDEEMTRAYFTTDSPFTGVSDIRHLDDTTVRITYQSSRPAMQKSGMILELASSAYRETAGAFTWESENVTARRVNVHFMHGFGWLVQMSRDVYYYDCNFMPRENSGHVTVGYADGIHASGAAGDLVIENCNFSNTHDDPINLHGTFTRVERRMDDHTLQLKYIHNQQGGFPQFHVGDQVAFFTRDTLESTDHETMYTVSEVISNPGEDGNDLRTMEIRFAEALPANLSDTVSGQPKYVAENVTYAPKVTIRNCTFKYVPTRGILCTTRNPVLIENNTFLNMSMATIYLSNDSDEWYESGPIRDMTIRNNTFYIKNIGRTSWDYAPAIYMHPVTKGGGLPTEDNPIHKNITIEGNTFHMDTDTVVKAESVENLKIRNNKILRTNPDVSIQLTAGNTELKPGEGTSLTAVTSGDTHTQAVDNVYEFTKCKDVLLEGNTYDDGLKRYAVVSGMSDSNLVNRDADIKVVTDRNQAVTDPVKEVRYASTDPDVVSVDAKGKLTAKKEGQASVFAYYEWNGTIMQSNRVQMTVGAGSTGESQHVTILDEDNIQLTEKGQTHNFQAQVQPAGSVSWSVEDFETGEATDAAEIDENGVLTAKENGIVWVRASAGSSSDQKAVLISLPQSDGLNPAFTIKREEASGYTLEKDRVSITMQSGDLYQTDNNVKNLFLYQLPDAIAKDNMRTVVKVDNLPVKEANYWDTGSFLLYKNDDNYISIGKKSHYNGITRVVETGGSATETGGNVGENAVSTAYLGFYKNGNQVSLDFKLEGGEWQHAATISDSAIGNDYQIGFATWGNGTRGKKLTFSEFHAASGDITYEALCEQEAIALSGVENQAPAASNAALDAASYQVGDSASVSFQYSDPDQDAEGRILYRFSYAGDTILEEVTASPSTTMKAAGTLTCYVYPVDEKGTPGIPAKVSAQVTAGEDKEELQELLLNGTALLEKAGETREFDVSLPAELEKAEVSYRMLGGSGGVQILVNGSPLGETYPGTASVSVPLSGEDTVQVKVSKDSIYTIHIRGVEKNDTQLDEIAIEELSFLQEQPSEGSWFLNAAPSVREAELKITGSDQIGSIRVLRDEYRSEMELKKEGNVYTAPLKFENGINSFYVQVTAKDGITMTQHMIHVNYSADTAAEPEMIRINEEDLDGFSAGQKDYLIQLKEHTDTLKIAVSKGTADRIKIAVNGSVTEGDQVTAENLKNGINEIQVIATAADGISRNVFTISAYLPYESNADLYHVMVDGKNILDQLEDGNSTVYVSGDSADLSIRAQDDRAKIEVSNGKTTYSGTGSLERALKLFQETSEITVKVTAKDGKTTVTEPMNFEKAAYLSDLAYNEGSTAGYGSIMKDKASSGSQLRVTGEDGAAVAYEKGIGTHADSVITYNLQGKEFRTLDGWAGVDYVQQGSANPAIQFTILGDGVTLFESGVMKGNTPAKHFTLDLTGVLELTLKAEQTPNNYNAHADWADMKLSAGFDSWENQNTYTQTILQAEGGVVSSDAYGNLLEGEQITYIFTPNQGYRIKQALVNGKEVELTDGRYTVASVKENLTATAVFEALPDKTEYTAAFTGGAGAVGTAPSQIKGVKGTGFRLPANSFTKSGYQFGGWHDGQKVYASGSAYVMPDRNVTFTAVWNKIPVKAPARVTGQNMKKSTSSSITLTWKAVSGAGGYEVQRVAKGKKNWSTVQRVATTTYTDKKLPAGKVYSYRIRAYASGDSSVYGAYSAAVSAATKPLAPKLSVKVLKGSMKLSWKKKTGADHYAIYRKIGNGKFKRIKTLKGSKNSYKVKTVKGKAYTFRIMGTKTVSKGKIVKSAYSKNVKRKAK